MNRNMKSAVQELLWLIPELLRDGPRTVGDMERTTQIQWRDLHDAVYECMQRGTIRLLPDSRFELLVPK